MKQGKVQWRKIVLALLLSFLFGMVATAVGQGQEPSPSATEAATDQAKTAAPNEHSSDNFVGYDFEQVVQRVETSVDPLQKEMSGSLKVFTESVQQAEAFLEEGKPQEAVRKCAAAMDGVLASREKVLQPMWEGQEYLNEQIGKVRDRLAQAVEASGGSVSAQLDKRAEVMLDGIAGRIAAEQDPMRKKRLVAQYRTSRQLARIKMMAEQRSPNQRKLARIKMMAKQLSPNQRKLWRNVLKVLEDTALTHQQVLMGTEVLFAQFEATAANLKEYQGLIDTVDGASKLLGVVRGLGQSGQGLSRFSRNMSDLQKRLAGFNEEIENTLQDKMFDLEAQADAIQNIGGQAEDEVGVMSADIDEELTARLKSLGRAKEKD